MWRRISYLKPIQRAPVFISLRESVRPGFRIKYRRELPRTDVLNLILYGVGVPGLGRLIQGHVNVFTKVSITQYIYRYSVLYSCDESRRLSRCRILTTKFRLLEISGAKDPSDRYSDVYVPVQLYRYTIFFFPLQHNEFIDSCILTSERKIKKIPPGRATHSAPLRKYTAVLSRTPCTAVLSRTITRA